MSLRTAAEVAEEYAAARTAYLEAVKLASYSTSSGDGSVSGSRQDIEALRKHMLALEREHSSMTRGGSPRVRGAVPIE